MHETIQIVPASTPIEERRDDRTHVVLVLAATEKTNQRGGHSYQEKGSGNGNQNRRTTGETIDTQEKGSRHIDQKGESKGRP